MTLTPTPISPPLLPIPDLGKFRQIAGEIGQVMAAGRTVATCAVLSPAADMWSRSTAAASQTLGVLNQGAANLEIFASVMSSITTELGRVEQNLRTAAGVDWESMAGDAFSYRAVTQAGRAASLANDSQQLHLLGKVAVEDVRGKIASAQSIVSSLGASVTSAVGAVC